jgi:hypothetical protein
MWYGCSTADNKLIPGEKLINYNSSSMPRWGWLCRTIVYISSLQQTQHDIMNKYVQRRCSKLGSYLSHLFLSCLFPTWFFQVAVLQVTSVYSLCICSKEWEGTHCDSRLIFYSSFIMSQGMSTIFGYQADWSLVIATFWCSKSCFSVQVGRGMKAKQQKEMVCSQDMV